MNATTYAMVASREPVNADEIERPDADVAEVVLSWGHGTESEGRNVLGATQIEKGESVTAGEAAGCTLFLPAEALGAASAELVTFDGGRARILRPSAAVLTVDGVAVDDELAEIGRGEVALLTLGAFTVRVTVSAAARPIAGSITASMRESALGGVGASAFLHASLFAAFALFMPALGANDAEAMERDQIVLMQHYLNASAESERDRVEADAAQGGSDAQDVNTASGGQRASGGEGVMGKPNTTTNGRWSAKGDAKPSDVTLSRAQEMAIAEGFGMIGVLAASANVDPRAPTVPWGSVLNGSDADSHTGNFWSASIDDAMGFGGLGMSGNEQGGGGKGEGYGINDIGGLGRSLDGRSGPGGGPNGGPGGFGGCKPGQVCGRNGLRGHNPTDIRMRMPPTIETNGRLMGEVIQRIVRQNQGRFRACYEGALSRNPSLEGRVAVRFVIDRTGAVSTAVDSGSDLPDEQVKACVVRSFYNLSFPQPSGGSVTVSYPIYFSPAS